MKCADCNFANKSANEEYVFCTKLQDDGSKSGLGLNEFIKEVVYKQPLPKLIAIGWGYPNKRFKSDMHELGNDTATEGLMWNKQICVHKDDQCNKFKSLEN